MHIEENRPLAPFTTFGIGGPARWFVEAASEDEIAEAAAGRAARSMPLFVLGGGSNLLVSDAGFDGLVLHVALRGIEWQRRRDHDFPRRRRRRLGPLRGADHSGQVCRGRVPRRHSRHSGRHAGTKCRRLWAGGGLGHRARAGLRSCRAQSFVEFTAAECGFAYRRSRFNSTDRGRYIVTRVDYRLKQAAQPHLAYADLKQHFQRAAAGQPSLAEVAAAVRASATARGWLLVEGDPDCRSAGSFFKNPVGPSDAQSASKH